MPDKIKLSRVKKQAASQKAGAGGLEYSLLSAISHDLRTPLTSIKGYASMVLDYGEKMKPEARRESLLAIIQASDRLVKLIDQIIDISRLSTGDAQLKKTRVDLGDLLLAAAENAGHRMPDFIINTVLETSPPPVEIDAQRIREVIDNFLDNAMRFSPPGSRIDVKAGICKGEATVCIQNQDIRPRQGSGPLPGTDCLEQGNNDIRGVSLNIMLSRTMVEMHGGRLWLERNGTGYKFCFSLPAIT